MNSQSHPPAGGACQARKPSRNRQVERREINEIVLTPELREETFPKAYDGERGPHAGQLIPIAIAPGAFADYGSGEISWGFGCQLLTEHVERRRKNGPCIILAAMKGGRENSDAQYACAVAYDVDGKLTLEQAIALVKARNLEAVIFTTFNNGNTVSHAAVSTVTRWAAAEGLTLSPTDIDETISRFCATRPKFDHLRNVRVLHGGKTVMVQERWGEVESFEFTHDPESKFRVVVLLREPIPLVGPDAVGAEGFSQIYNAIGNDLWHGRHDRSCSNPSRIFYLPSHRSGADFFAEHFYGEPLDWRPYWKPESKPDVEQLACARSIGRPEYASAGAEELAAVLNSIPADVPYSEWFRCLAAIYHETEGAEDGRELAHTWSSEDPRYNPDQVDAIWDWLRPNHRNPASMGSLIHIARQYDRNFRLPGQKRRPLGPGRLRFDPSSTTA